MTPTHSPRRLTRIIESVPASDGAGVKLRRSLGRSQLARLDPFLLLDEFSSYEASDYLAGFPAHPHRGFETITYILDGHMVHEDHLGNRGDLQSGGVQWMTAGRGIIHSEMPQQQAGRMRGFQLWLNLPAREKMKPAGYRDIPAGEIPRLLLGEGSEVRVIAGRVEYAGTTVTGPIAGLTTDPTYLDIVLAPGAGFTHSLAVDYHACLYPYEGSIEVIAGERSYALPGQQLGVLSDGDTVELRAGAEGARVLLLAGRPIGEPIAQYGPFVMNTREEVEQAVRDFQAGTLTGP